MLRPNKHSHPDQTVVNAAFIILRQLLKRRVAKFDELRQLVKDRVSGGEFLFLPAVSFLFILGLVEYRRKTDMFEFINQE